MKSNKIIHNNDDINVLELLNDIWHEKVKIALIALIITVIFIIHNKYKEKEPQIFVNSLEIGAIKEQSFLGFLSVYNYLGISIGSQDVLEQFVEEFLDYEELITVLNNFEDIKEKLTQLSDQEQQQMLYSYAKLFNITREEVFYGEEKGNNTSHDYVLEFTWGYDREQARYILDRALKLTLKNLEKSIFLNLDAQYKLKKNSTMAADEERIEYLSEQSSIAKKLNIEKSKNDFLNLTEIQASFNFSGGHSRPYYSRGYKAIDMEISVIKNRKYKQLLDIEKKISLLKKKKVRWVDYNIFLLDSKSKNLNRTFSLVIIILFSLLIGVFYVLISNTLKSYKYTKKKTN